MHAYILIHCVFDSSIAWKCMRADDEKQDINLVWPKYSTVLKAKVLKYVAVTWLPAVLLFQLLGAVPAWT